MENLLIYGNIFDSLDELTNEEAGQLFKALNSFRKGEEVSFQDRYLRGLWVGIKPNLENLKENYLKKVASNRENGKKGGRPPKTSIKPGIEAGSIEETSTPTKIELETPIENNGDWMRQFGDAGDDEKFAQMVKEQEENKAKNKEQKEKILAYDREAILKLVDNFEDLQTMVKTQFAGNTSDYNLDGIYKHVLPKNPPMMEKYKAILSYH